MPWPLIESTDRRWRLWLPSAPPVTLNRRGHWANHSRNIAEWVHSTAYCLRAARVPRLDRARVRLDVWPPDRRRRDRHNLHGTLKPCLDGIVQAGVLRDDTPDHLVAEDLVFHHDDPQPQWTYQLTIEACHD